LLIMSSLNLPGAKLCPGFWFNWALNYPDKNTPAHLLFDFSCSRH
jgi:hypothetical protein